ncbi:MAG: hypothetical protein J6A89_01780 [Clostridia bacterium]|nr:hypothetical protein [Clostridia bacterium]
MKEVRVRKRYVIAIIFMVSIFIAITLSFKIERNMFTSTTEEVSTIEVKEIIEDGEVVDKIDIKYDWQITIPKISLIAPIDEGSDVMVLKNNVGHISGTGIIERKYMFSRS